MPRQRHKPIERPYRIEHTYCPHGNKVGIDLRPQIDHRNIFQRAVIQRTAKHMLYHMQRERQHQRSGQRPCCTQNQLHQRPGLFHT